MTKLEAQKLLEQGKRVSEIFPLTPGQDCMIYKGEWLNSPDIIYIPDIDLNELDAYYLSAEDKVGNMYTAQDFINEAYGNVKAAEGLFNFCDWQHPNIQDLIDITTDEEAKELYGQTWEEMEKNCTEFVEMCPHCEYENHYCGYDPDKNGYVVICQYCGKEIMLCDACRERNRLCDWNEKTGCHMKER
jgi:hypothetical protein